MPVTTRWLAASGSVCLVSLALAAPAMAQASTHWRIDGPAVSGEVTGTGAPHRLDEAPSAEEQMPPQLAQAPAAEATPQAAPAPANVDETALRFFARQGDTRRLEIEIARLRALYPDWTPPADPLAVPVNVDERLEAIWELYSQGRLAEARQAIAQRQTDEDGWQPPADLLDRLALAEARERLINASEIDQYETVIRLGSENPQLLTCGEVDVLWRVAEAFARTERQARARDAYRYILTSCDNAQERRATLQNASQLLDQPMLDELLALERFDDAGAGEFAPVRDDLARNAVARGGEDATATVPAEQLARVDRLASEGRAASDSRLLGWYYLQRENYVEAEKWFRMARESEDSADASEGLALALMARGQHAEAEEIIYPWRGDTEDTRNVYLGAAANLLGTEPRPTLAAEVLTRIVAEVAAARDVAAARQLGWYARAWEQHETAGQWFSTALGWNPDDEPSAYGLALTRHLLGDAAGLADIKRIWAGRSDRIQQVGLAVTEPAPAVPATPAPPVQQRSSAPAAAPAAMPQTGMAAAAYAPTSPIAPNVAPQAAPATATLAPATNTPPQPTRRSSCGAGSASPGPEASLQQGWCLMDANRPVEAARAFEIALQASSERIRRDAAWGQSLAYLRSELVDEAAVAAVAAPQTPARANELQTAILAQRAAGAFERGRYVETLLALDQRAQIAPERIDLMVLRGYAYLRLNRTGDARRVFRAVAGTGDREGLRGLAAVEAELQQTR
jgi:tetratricopeptide (TPR) repeat protein